MPLKAPQSLRHIINLNEIKLIYLCFISAKSCAVFNFQPTCKWSEIKSRPWMYVYGRGREERRDTCWVQYCSPLMMQVIWSKDIAKWCNAFCLLGGQLCCVFLMKRSLLSYNKAKMSFVMEIPCSNRHWNLYDLQVCGLMSVFLSGKWIYLFIFILNKMLVYKKWVPGVYFKNAKKEEEKNRWVRLQ